MRQDSVLSSPQEILVRSANRSSPLIQNSAFKIWLMGNFSLHLRTPNCVLIMAFFSRKSVVSQSRSSLSPLSFSLFLYHDTLSLSLSFDIMIYYLYLYLPLCLSLNIRLSLSSPIIILSLRPRHIPFPYLFPNVHPSIYPRSYSVTFKNDFSPSFTA